MSLGSPKLARREQAIEAARRRLRRLEIETHRIKAELARLEAEYEDDVADRLTHKLRRRRSADSNERFDVAGDSAPSIAVSTLKPAVLPFAAPKPAIHTPRKAAAGEKRTENGGPAHVLKVAPSSIKVDPDGSGTPAHRHIRPRATATLRKNASPLAFSFAVHAVALVFCMTVTYATLVQQNIPLFASPTDDENDIPVQLSEVEIKPSKFDDAELENTILQSDEFNIADSLARELEPAQLGAGTRPLGDIGQLDALPSDLGTLMAGAGSPGRGKPGGDLSAAVFFAARSTGTRFVFVIDNSSSMKGGRLEMAISELLKSIGGLTAKQTFYVIFVSDQTYPMFYPQPEPDLLAATDLNKKRLSAWLPKAILASGKNREMIKAMDLAAALRPHAVYLLWDGDLKYSEKVRMDVMTHLTRPNQWNFVIHTLGMGNSSLDSEQNLSAIALAHGGIYRRIDIPTIRPR